MQQPLTTLPAAYPFGECAYPSNPEKSIFPVHTLANARHNY